VYCALVQALVDVQLLWPFMPGLEQTPALVQLGSFDLFEMEQAPAAAQLLWLV